MTLTAHLHAWQCKQIKLKVFFQTAYFNNLFMRKVNSVELKGFVIKSSTPRSKAFITVSSCPKDVNSITLTSFLKRSFTCFTNSNPLTNGIITSETTRFGVNSFNNFIASRQSAAVLTSKFSFESLKAIVLSNNLSSSITKTFCFTGLSSDNR
jgi:hypothetical protein